MQNFLKKFRLWGFRAVLCLCLVSLIFVASVWLIDKMNQQKDFDYNKEKLSSAFQQLDGIHCDDYIKEINDKYVMYILCKDASTYDYDETLATEFHRIEEQELENGIHYLISDEWSYFPLSYVIERKLFGSVVYSDDSLIDSYDLLHLMDEDDYIHEIGEYRYGFKLMVKKDNMIYALQAFTKNPKYQNEIITEFVNRINATKEA